MVTTADSNAFYTSADIRQSMREIEGAAPRRGRFARRTTAIEEADFWQSKVAWIEAGWEHFPESVKLELSQVAYDLLELENKISLSFTEKIRYFGAAVHLAYQLLRDPKLPDALVSVYRARRMFAHIILGQVERDQDEHRKALTSSLASSRNGQFTDTLETAEDVDRYIDQFLAG